MVVLRIARQARRHLVERQLREDRDAVEGFLTVDCYVVAQGLEGLARKGLVLGLGFLQAHDVGLPLPQPGGEVFDSLLDRVYVPAGNANEGVRVGPPTMPNLAAS